MASTLIVSVVKRRMMAAGTLVFRSVFRINTEELQTSKRNSRETVLVSPVDTFDITRKHGLEEHISST